MESDGLSLEAGIGRGGEPTISVSGVAFGLSSLVLFFTSKLTTSSTPLVVLEGTEEEEEEEGWVVVGRFEEGTV